MNTNRIIVSACLAGLECNYKQQSNSCQKVIDLVKDGAAITVCPEQLGGLPTPRIPAEITGNRVINRKGEDVTFQFAKGAEEALKLAQLSGASEAVLKANSPSCGVGKIYDGNFKGNLIKGNGVFAQLLLNNGFEVKSEKDL